MRPRPSSTPASTSIDPDRLPACVDADLRALRARAHITASSLHPGADWFHELSDGYGRIDVRMLMQTNDGAVIHVAYRGLVEATTRRAGRFSR